MDSTYVYRDRKMLKWLPFNALIEQASHIQAMVKEKYKVEQRSLSIDQYDELNYVISEAIECYHEVDIEYFQDGYHHVTGFITEIDMYHHTLQIGHKILPIKSIVSAIKA
jgi:hypothetical protein